MKIYPIIVYPAFYKYIRLFGKKVSERCNWFALGFENMVTKHIDYTFYIGLKEGYKWEEGSI